MTMQLDSPKDIYSYLRKEVEKIAIYADSLTDTDLSGDKEKITTVLTDLLQKITDETDSLEKNANWDTFTIAFYGETNAGKSTIIETVRILLQEQAKIDSQRQFKNLQSKYNITAKKRCEIIQLLSELDERISNSDCKIRILKSNYKREYQELEERISVLDAQIKEKKEAMLFWQKLINIFKKTKEEKQKKSLSIKQALFTTNKDNEISVIESLKVNNSRKKALAKEEFIKFESNEEKLSDFLDGGIIGDGRSDFTRKTNGYIFKSRGKSILLLDIPGIEGNEDKVKNNISLAVQKAHAVFYVTGKATPPQKGEKETKGTLEKIKDHLGSQTEVWTIFNKRINNPRSLKKELINEDEQESLKDLNNKMKEQLGEHYQGVISLSALPAFFAVAECFLPSSPILKKKGKFLESFTRNEILEKTQFDQFCDFLSCSLAKGHKEKIARSNFNKANQIVKDVILKISTIQEDQLNPLEAEIKKKLLNAQEEVDLSYKSFNKNIESEAHKAIDNFQNAVRKKTYKSIEKDISEDEFKSKLKKHIKEEQKTLEKSFPRIIKNELNRFEGTVSKILKSYQEHVDDLVDIYGRSAASRSMGDFELSINIDSGINIASLISVLGGVVLLIWNPAGWFVAAIGAVTLIVGAVKAVLGFFSSKYKKAQQRKAVNQNLKKITLNIKKAIDDSLLSSMPELESKIKDIKNELEKPKDQIVEFNMEFKNSNDELLKLMTDISTFRGGDAKHTG